MDLRRRLGISGSRVNSSSATLQDASDLNQVVQPFNLWDEDRQKQAIAFKRYEENYKRLYKQLPKEWRPYLTEMASSAVGQSILANLPENLDVDEVDASDLNGAGACYDSDKNTLQLSDVVNSKTGADGKYEPYMCLVHELRHAAQDRLGLTLGRGNSPSDMVMNTLLSEADAFAFGNSEQVVMNVFGTSKPSKDQILAFMRRDLINEGRKNNQGLSLDQTRKRVQESSEYVLQQALKSCNGNLAKAKQKLRQRVFNAYWRGASYFDQISYEMQGLSFALRYIENGQSDRRNDPRLMQQIKVQIARAHGISLAELEKGGKVTPALKKSLQLIKNNPHLSSEQLKKGIEGIYLQEIRNRNSHSR